MTLRGVIKSSLPVYFSDTVQAQRQLAPVYQGFFFQLARSIIPCQTKSSGAGIGAANLLRRTWAVLIETKFQSHYTQDSTFFGSLHQLFTRELGFSFWNLTNPFHGKTGQALWADAVFINPAMVS